VIGGLPGAVRALCLLIYGVCGNSVPSMERTGWTPRRAVRRDGGQGRTGAGARLDAV